MAEPEAKTLIRADDRKLDRDLAKAKGKFKRSFMGIGRGIKSAVGGALTSSLGVGLGIGGAVALGKGVIDLDKTLTAIRTQAALAGPEAAASIAQIGPAVDELSSRLGLSRQEIAMGAKAIVDLKGANEQTIPLLQSLAEVSIATGSSMTELAGVAFSLDNSLQIKSGKDFIRSLDIIAVAGAKASVPLDKMSGFLQKSSAALAQFVEPGIKGVSILAAMAQTGRKTFGSIEEVSTASANLGLALNKLNVEGTTNIKSIRQLVVELDKLGAGSQKQKETILELFPEKKVQTLVTEMVRLGDDGRVAFLKIADEADNAGTAMKDSLGRVMKSESFKITKALNQAKRSLEEAFTPERIKLVTKAIVKMADLLAFMVDNAVRFAGVWAGMKLGGLVLKFAEMAELSGKKGIEGNTKKISKNMTKINTGVGLISAGLIGWNVGKLLDQWLGISDAISDAAINSASLAKDQTGRIREQAGKLQAELKTVGGDFSKLSPEGKNRAREVARTGAESGLFGKQGGERAFAVGSGLTRFTPQFTAGRAGFGVGGVSESAQEGQQFEKLIKVLQNPRVLVEIDINQQGLLTAKKRGEAAKRKSPF